MASNYLFAEQFRNIHGLTIEQALEGYGSINRDSSRVYDPDEYQRLLNDGQRFRNGGWKEYVEKTLSEKRPMGDIINDWTYAKQFVRGESVRVGRTVERITPSRFPVEVARDIRDLTEEMHRSGKVNDVPLYRGARREPIEDVEGNKPISYSEDVYVARSFTTGGNGRRIFKAPVGTVRGLRVPDYVEIQRTVGKGRRPEREWLIDPNSIVGRA